MIVQMKKINPKKLSVRLDLYALITVILTSSVYIFMIKVGFHNQLIGSTFGVFAWLLLMLAKRIIFNRYLRPKKESYDQ